MQSESEVEKGCSPKLVKNKNKKAYQTSKEIYVEVKPKARGGKCVGAPQIETSGAAVLPSEETYNHISDDVWYHISRFIQPEDTKNFALICRQTASLTNRREYWRNLYQRYIHKHRHTLPAYFRDGFKDGNAKLYRYLVIKSLYYCYGPLMFRIANVELDTLHGFEFVSTWHTKNGCHWYICHKFRNPRWSSNRCLMATETKEVEDQPVREDWEALAVEHATIESSDRVAPTTPAHFNPYEGVTLLSILSTGFVPLPAHLLYEGNNNGRRLRVKSTREMLSADLCGASIELDFIDSINQSITKVKYPKIATFRVVPWWHPDFEKFLF